MAVAKAMVTIASCDFCVNTLPHVSSETSADKFFARHGYTEIGESIVSPDVYAELVRSPDEGVAEFLDLSRVKPNTLGNTRMLKKL